jgi:hypothetical protein
VAAPGLASDAHLRVADGSAGANVPALQQILGHDARRGGGARLSFVPNVSAAPNPTSHTDPSPGKRQRPHRRVRS